VSISLKKFTLWVKEIDEVTVEEWREEERKKADSAVCSKKTFRLCAVDLSAE